MPEITVDTPNGPFALTEADGVLIACGWRSGGSDRTPLLQEAAAQVRAYHDGALRTFDLPWRAPGSAFQQAACAYIASIPFGDTVTYAEMAKALNVSAQAAGKGCGGNPLPLVVPCHRVLGSNGLGGFSGTGGIETKVWLLRHEGAAGLLI
ncbi:methylated-DNA--[protein]-cysteine S-methyltransferase [Sagittula sp. S175]|uniref:methylated-DNA--[protein]-cysteine S-methyltransferase n=1 Tax=Sagittula sp. S175 TaxID=3415129 RepID=UPI003C79C55F